MFRLSRLIAVLPALLVALPTLSSGADAPSEDPKVRAKLIQAEYLEGKLTESSLDGEEKSFTIHVMKKSSVLNKDTEKKINDLATKIQQAEAGLGKKPNPTQVTNIQNMGKQLTDLKTKLYDEVEVPYEFQCKAKALYLRRLKLPAKDGGAKYTPEELEKLRGDKRLDGYNAEAGDFEKDSLVRVWLDKNRLPSTTDKKKDEVPSYAVKMIMLLPQPEEKKPKDPPAKK